MRGLYQLASSMIYSAIPATRQSVIGTTSAARQIAFSLLGEVEWEPFEDFGYCRCPGLHYHQSPTGKRDTRIYLNRVPTITCFHTSCLATLQDANRTLRSAIGKYERGTNPYIKRIEKSAVQIVREREKTEAAHLATLAQRALPRILEDYHWPLSDIYHDSPEALGEEVSNDWRSLLSLFEPEDVVWIGDKRDSGMPRKLWHFRTASEWLTQSTCPAGPLISPFAYLPGMYSRKAKYVRTRKFLVIESDSLPMEHQGALLRWLRDAAGIRLRAVIDAAGKSIHGWFDPPDADVMLELKSVVPAIKGDPALLRPSQVSRLPGCRRGQAFQRLLYFDGEKESL